MALSGVRRMSGRFAVGLLRRTFLRGNSVGNNNRPFVATILFLFLEMGWKNMGADLKPREIFLEKIKEFFHFSLGKRQKKGYNKRC